MRRYSIVLAIGLMGCTGSVVPCTDRPTDPLCQDIDSGGGDDGGPGDTGVDAPMGDAHVPCGGSCNGSTPHCLVSGTTETCVGCTGETDCTSATAMHCEPTSHACVECLDNAACTDATMSLCDDATHSCVGCTANGDCTHISGASVCDGTAGCVECTASDRTACASGICITSTNACAPAGGTTATCGSCTHDAECRAGQLCVPMTYDDPTTPAADPVAVGNHCLWRQDAAGTGAPSGSCLDIRPYVQASSLSSVDGTTAMVCTLALSTCEAQAGFRMTDCMTIDATGDARCGATGVHDGMCQMFDSTHNRCTVFCLSDDDCRTGVACDTSVTPTPVCHF